MSTHSCVGRYNDKFGRYVHFDGFPGVIGSNLVKIINRDGAERALQVIVDEHPYGWSYIDDESSGSFSDAEKEIGYDDGRFEPVNGYGVAYTSKQMCGEESILDTNDTEYAYMIETDGTIHVYTCSSSEEIATINAYSQNAVTSMYSLDDD